MACEAAVKTSDESLVVQGSEDGIGAIVCDVLPSFPENGST